MNLNLLNWIIKGLGSHRKRHILHDLIAKDHIDVVMIQETKKDTFFQRALKTISHKFDIWHWLPSNWSSGRILFGGGSNKIKVLNWFSYTYCLDVQIENKLNSTIWQLTIVYGPVLKAQKPMLWRELDRVRTPNISIWALQCH